MKIAPFDHQLRLNVPTAGYVRTPGLHMSDIYGSLYAELDPKRFDKPGPPDEVAMAYGTGFENDLEEAIARQESTRLCGERPGEYAATADAKVVPVGTPKSIIFSPDFFLYNGVTRLGEFKSTRMTIAKGIRDRKFDKWMCQMMAYAYPLQMLHARLYALFINGHGKWEDTPVPDFGVLPSGPLLLAWDIEFTVRELETNWQMLIRHARKKGMDI